MEFAHPPAQRPDADASLDLLLDLLVEAAAADPTLLVIDEFTLADIVDAGFASTDGRSNGLSGLVHHVTGGHPYRAMQLADAA